jgi:predicted ArsR family transcriptional regulator
MGRKPIDRALLVALSRDRSATVQELASVLGAEEARVRESLDKAEVNGLVIEGGSARGGQEEPVHWTLTELGLQTVRRERA